MRPKARNIADTARALWARTPAVAIALAAITLAGWTLNEVVPRYGVDRHRHEAPGRLDRPTFLVGDCVYYRATLVSLLEDRDLDVMNNLVAQNFPLPSNVAMGRNGAFYPKHSVLLPVVALPFYVVAGDAGLLAFNLAQLCALVLVMWLGARRYAPDAIVCPLMLWFAFGTLLRPVAYNFSPDVFSTLLVAGGIVALLYERNGTAGVLLGLSLWAKWTNAVFFPVAAAALVARRDWRALLRFGAAAAVPTVGLLGLNWHMFGSPFVTPSGVTSENSRPARRAAVEIDSRSAGTSCWVGTRRRRALSSRAYASASSFILVAVPLATSALAMRLSESSVSSRTARAVSS